MNKSLILVMCDVLVLSAMSLSTGGFNEERGYNSVSDNNYGGSVYVADEMDARVRNLEKLLSDASNRLAAVSHDLLAKSNQLHQSTMVAVSLARDLSDARGMYGRATNQVGRLQKALDDEIAQTLSARRLLSCASNELIAVSCSLSNASNALAVATSSVYSLSNDLSALLGRYKAATNELAEVREQWDNEIGNGFTRRQEVVRNCRYCLFVKHRNDDKGKIYYSPLVSIGTNRYVIAYVPRKNIHSIVDLKVLSMTSYFGEIESIYGLGNGCDEDVLFFKVNGIMLVNTLFVGMISPEKPWSQFYWLSSRAGDIEKVGIMSASANRAWNDYKKIEPGDMLISDCGPSVVSMATANVPVLKNEVRFDRITEQDLVLLRKCR